MQKYNKADVVKASANYFGGDELAADVFANKYALRDLDNNFYELTPDSMHKRLAKEFARIESKYPNAMTEEEIYNWIADFGYIIPQGSPMAAVGNPFQIMSVGNCFVIETHDSYAGIMKTDEQFVHIYRRRGGCGLSMNPIRPKGMSVKNAANTTDGVGLFMERFSRTCREVATNGRRGAQMLSLSVHHPDIETFITIKQDTTKVTGANVSVEVTDEFMQAVEAGTTYEQRWPVDAKDPKISKQVDARNIWNLIIESAWKSAEPGVLFIDTIINNSLSDIYEKFGYKTVSSNPCHCRNSLIAVADGRNAVTIEQLANEGKDVPVYSIDPATGEVSIKLGRNPRITGYEKQLVRVTLDNGFYLDVTPDHKFMRKDGSKCEAKDLQFGDSLMPFEKTLTKVKEKDEKAKWYYSVKTNAKTAKNVRAFEHRMIAKFFNEEDWNAMYDANKQSGWMQGGLVVHHKDYDGLNNAPENLQLMTFKEHQRFHAEHDTQGFKNGRSYKVTNEEIKEHALNLTKQFGRRFSKREWHKYAKNNGLPLEFSEWRKEGLANDATNLGEICASELGIAHAEIDPRVVKSYQSMIEQGYTAKIQHGTVIVEKHCENCNNIFEVNFLQREQACCSYYCSFHINKDKQNQLQLANKLQAKSRAENSMQKQIEVYSSLKFELNRTPMRKEWEKACKEKKVPFRLGHKMQNGFKYWDDVKNAGDAYNHKVISVEPLEGLHTVYNITVDDNHSLCVVRPEFDEKSRNYSYKGVGVFQCGELVLNAHGQCILLLINCMGFVQNPFTKNAKFDKEKFKKACYAGQKLLDDLVDIELDCIDRIIAKVESDPEPQWVKQVELDLWKKIQETCRNSRRTGEGLTAVGDCLAALGIQYGSQESIDFVQDLYKELATESHRASVHMARDRGTFPIFDFELEKNHPYLERLLSYDNSLREEYAKYGRRNIANTTTPPAGTTSLVALLNKERRLFGTTSGIEPAYSVHFGRKRKINPDDKTARVDLVDEIGDKWQFYEVDHSGFRLWKELNNKTDANFDESPYFKATANDVNWVASVELQAKAQESVDHAISKTANVPSNISVETVSEMYLQAWKKGCKGFTIYRDGSRFGVLTTKTEEVESDSRPLEIVETNAPKRPPILPCSIHHAKIKGESYVVLIGTLNGKPYEVFCGLSNSIDIPKSIKTGHMHRNDKTKGMECATYDLIDSQGNKYENVIELFHNPIYGAFTRAISICLRHGVPMKYLTDQLKKDKSSDITSFSNVIARVLSKNYLNIEEKQVCPSCNSTSLKMQEGCMSCTSCGYSKCG